MQFPDTVIQIFCKAPVPGTVKTRLIPELTAVQAVEVHQQLTLQTLALVVESNLCSVQLWCAPSTQHAFFENLATHFPVTLKTQAVGDLGHRMNRAITEGLQTYHKVILLGCDCPSFTIEDISAAIQALQAGYQAVIAPTEDSGYSLIGMQQPAPTVFQNIDWSTAEVLAQTREKLHRENLSCFELPIQWDVDTYADYLRFIKEFKPVPLTEN